MKLVVTVLYIYSQIITVVCVLHSAYEEMYVLARRKQTYADA
jgi:hypothetical protein